MRNPNEYQGSAQFWNDRLGKLTGSRMSDAMSFLKSGKESTARENLRREIVAERLSDTYGDHFVSDYMEWGIQQEASAKEAFERMTGLIVTDVGFIDHPTIPMCGASPDGFTSDGCLIEVKCPKSKNHMKWIEDQLVPEEHKPQMILQSACTGKDVWFVSYDPRMKPEQQLFIKKFRPTPEEIKTIETAAIEFLKECDALFDFYVNKAVYFDEKEIS